MKENSIILFEMARKILNSASAAADAKRCLAATKKAILHALSKCVHDNAMKNGGKLPYGHMQSFVNENRKIYKWITRDALNSAYTRYNKSVETADSTKAFSVRQVEVSTRESNSSQSLSTLSHSYNFNSTGSVAGERKKERKKDGHPVDSSGDKKRKRLDEIVAMKNDITAEFIKLKGEKRVSCQKERRKELLKSTKLKGILKMCAYN